MIGALEVAPLVVQTRQDLERIDIPGEKLRALPVVTPSGPQIPLSALADIRVEDGPPMIKSENARLNGWIYVDIAGVDLGTYVEAARKAVAEQVKLPVGYSINWSGQYEYMERAKEHLWQQHHQRHHRQRRRRTTRLLRQTPHHGERDNPAAN